MPGWIYRNVWVCDGARQRQLQFHFWTADPWYGDKGKDHIRRLLCRSARVRRSSTVAAAGPKTRSRYLKAVQIKVYGYKTTALVDSGAVPNLISEKLCKKLNR